MSISVRASLSFAHAPLRRAIGKALGITFSPRSPNVGDCRVRGRGGHRCLNIALVVLCAATSRPAAAMTSEPMRVNHSRAALPAGGDVSGTVTDSTNQRPLPGVEVAVQRGSQVIANVITDPFGRYIMHNIAAGAYVISAHFIGYRAKGAQVTIASGTVHVNFKLFPAPATLEAVQVTAQAPVAVDTRTGDQTFSQNEAIAAPSTTTSALIQQSIAGAARAPTGEVHIRGQHAEYTYYIDGVPVPPGVAGSLNELFNPDVVQQIDFQTGGWDAEYGGRQSAVINIETRIPAGPFHMEESTYDGTFNTMGQSATLSANAGKLGMFISGQAQGTDMRLDPVVGTTSNGPINYHNHGEDYYGFTKLQYAAGPHDLFSIDGNYSTTHFDVPYDSTLALLNDHQTDVNSFINLAYRHKFGEAVGTGEESQPAELFVGPYFRDGSLNYRPGAADQPSFIDSVGDPSLTPRDVFENRNFYILGVKTDLSFPVIAGLMDGKIGTTYSHTYGHENFELIDPTGAQPPIGSNSGLNGYDFGTYAETNIRPVEWFELRTGLRFDSHVEPFASNQTQASPRIRLNFFPDPANSFYLYFGRLFMPTNIEDLRDITSAAQGGAVTSPTLPERDAFYEVGYLHRFPFGIVTKLSGYHKESTPGIDDNTITGSAITTDVNISHIWVTGLEGVIEVRPEGPLTGYVNLALNHAYGIGPITGGFFPIQTPPTYFDLDHDQRFSGVWNLLYSQHRIDVSATGIYGTGLTNGFTPDTNRYNIGTPGTSGFQPGNASYCTSLFCFNRAFKVAPSYIQNLSLGYYFYAGQTSIKPEVFFANLFNSAYILKGAFFSGQSIGRPFTVQFKLSIGV
jgi:hypothetical protein